MKGLSLGTTLLNLAVSNNRRFGICKGQFLHLVGDSTTGKSWIAAQILAELCQNSEFDDYYIEYNDAENGLLMDIKTNFGSRLQKRINITDHVFIEDVYDRIDELGRQRKPYIYVVDSMDSLFTQEDEEQIDKENKARSGGKKATGSYKMTKPKKNSERLRKIVNQNKKTGSIIIIISQAKDNIGFGFEDKRFSGGKALQYYAHVSIWTSLLKTVVAVKGQRKRVVGTNIRFKVKKNRITGQVGSVKVLFSKQHGFDDIATNIEYLVDEKHWTKKKGKVYAKEFMEEGMSTQKLIRWIEQNNKEIALQKIVAKLWKKIQKDFQTERKSRYE